jgi:thiosulfate/3-mercaptopyruvate sulfurtransferase
MLHTVALTLLLAVPADELTKTYPRADLLVEPTDLAKLAEKADVRVLDARPRDAYKEGHVPGAAWVDHAAWSSEFAKEQDIDKWHENLKKLGIHPKTQIIIYDDNLSKDAARIWWILRYWGIKDVRLVNGGWKAWLASGGKPTKDETEKDLSPSRKEEWRDSPVEKQRLATKDELLKLLQDKPPQLIDARSIGEYCGTQETAKHNGAIPGAVHLEWSDLLDKKTGRFKSADELTKLFKDAGIDPAKPAVTYCQSGGRASVMAFGLELMGGKEVRNYYRSWAEWGNDDATPIVKPKK